MYYNIGIIFFILVQSYPNDASNEMILEKILQEQLESNSYRGTIRPTDKTDTRSAHQGIVIKVQMVINELGKLSEAENDFSASLTLDEKWIDKRLILNESFEFLSLTYLKSKIWIPDLYFYNMKSSLTTTTNPSLMWLYPDGTIIYSTTIRLKFYCHMNLWRFPLDSQKCYMELGSYGYPTQDLKLEWWYRINEVTNNVRLVHAFNSDFLLPQISIRINDSSTKLNGLFSVLIIKFTFTRNFVYHLIFTFLPSALIVSVSWVSFLIDYKAAPARVSFCLLTLLSIMTQWSNINSSLPRLSYLKSIDVWMFICLSFIILSLFEFAIVNRMAIIQEKKRLHSQIPTLLNTEFHNLTEPTNVDPLNVSKPDHMFIKLPLNIIAQKHKTYTKQNRRHDDKPKIKPAEIDVIASYAFPITFIIVNVIFWGVLYF